MELTTTTTYQAGCPCGCGQTVTVTDGGFSTTSVSVAPCGQMAASGIVGYSVRKSQAPAEIVAPVVRHRDGLVGFEGGL